MDREVVREAIHFRKAATPLSLTPVIIHPILLKFVAKPSTDPPPPSDNGRGASNPLAPLPFVFMMLNLHFILPFEMKGASGPTLTALWYVRL